MRTVAPTLAANARRAPLPARRCDRGTTSTSRLRAPPPGRGAAASAERGGGPVGTVPSENDAPSSSAASTAHGTPRWREFTLAFAGGWRGRSVEFDARGVARDIPIRYVHGVGRVPRANMPFADEDFDWVTRCECVATDHGVRIDASRAMPEIGNEDAISSCGAAEWNDGAELVIADETLRILRGPGEDKTILPDGSFSAGARTLPTRPCATNDDADADTDVTVVHQCLADPSDENRRVRIVQRVAFDAAAKKHRAVSCDAWMERRERSCPRGFSDAPRVDTIAPNDKAWVRSPSASSGSVVATWRLTWPVVDPGPDAKDGGSTFEVEEEGAFVEEGAVEGAVAVAGTPVANGVGQLLRLPAGMWAYCGDDPLAPDEFVVVECGYHPNAGGGERERAVASRRYRKADGKLVRVTLGRERLVDAARG